MRRHPHGCPMPGQLPLILYLSLDGEVRQGKLVADLAAHAGVDHLVYSSVGGAEQIRGIPHFDSKWQVEQHIRATGLPATILRPQMRAGGHPCRAAGTGHASTRGQCETWPVRKSLAG